MSNPNARISRVRTSWRVRVFGHSPQFFADGKYGGTSEALHAARAWRDAHWDGWHRSAKLTDAEREAVRRSTEDYKQVAERYGITRQYVHELRKKR